jgi:hypothetical protein
MMKIALSAIVLFAFTGVVSADDHLVEALEHGLTEDSQLFQTNPAGRCCSIAPGQASPFSGEETKTPATETEAANDHANVKDRDPK